MNSHSFKSLLAQWQSQTTFSQQRVSCQVEIPQHDLQKLEALAETFQLERNEVVASLLHLAILEIEEKMPYIPGSKVIRVEEGEEIYEDQGPMPRYLAAQQKLKSNKE